MARFAASVFALVALLAVAAGGQTRGAEGRGARGSVEPASTPECSPGGASLRMLARSLSAKYTDRTEFTRALDAAVGVDTTFADAHSSISISSRDALSISVRFPYQAYRESVLDALRKRDPIDAITVPSSVSVSVFVFRIDAPDIVKVVVERDGKVVPARLNQLKTRLLTTALGARALLHEGSVLYPCAAFDPDASVRVIAIPEAGSNIVAELPSDQLLMFSAKRSEAAVSLMGKPSTVVEARLGKPAEVDGSRWLYNLESGLMRVYFSDEKTVTQIEPPAYDLRRFKKKEPSVVSLPSPATAQQPAPVQPRTPSVTREPSPLIGLTKDQVVAKFGPPSVTNADVLYYDRPAGTLRIYMTEGRVSSVKPEDFDLASLAPLPKPSAATPVPATPAPPPAGAVAKCGDGQFVFVATGDQTCAGHGGVGVWVKKP